MSPKARAPQSPAPRHPQKVRTKATERLLAKARARCLSLPDAVEKPSHGEPTWFAGKGKVFAMFDDHHHGAAHVALWLPLPLGAQEALIAAEPECYFKPPYVGPAGWVGVRLDRKLSWDVIASHLRDAFLHVATAKLAARLNG